MTADVLLAFEAALRGDFSRTRSIFEAGTLDATIQAALGTVTTLANGGVLDERALRALPDDESELLPRTCAYHVLAAALSFDAESCARLSALQSELARSPYGQMLAARAATWCDYLAGLDVRAEASRFGRQASELGAGAYRIEATALTALTEMAYGRSEDAVASARRAARMAQAEGLVHHEYLANIVLARVRRQSGAPHLAARILGGLAPVVPPVWERWLDWESALAGAPCNGLASEAVRAALSAATQGDHSATTQWFRKLASHVAMVRPFSNELEELWSAVDPRRDPIPSSWASGASSNTWEVLSGDIHDAPPSAYVYVSPAGDARRIVGAGKGLLDAGLAHVSSTQRKDARVMRFAAVLALCGRQGLSEAELFRRVYGFDFEPKHEGTARVLLHRVRGAFGEHASIVRDDGHMFLKPVVPILVADPRCARTLEQRVMMLLGTLAGELTAVEIASALEVSIRQAQRVLKMLIEKEVCTAREARQPSYRIEDTTFLEPTRSRVMPMRQSPV